MDWIKKNPHYLALILLSLVLLGASAAVVVNTQSFGQNFASLQSHPAEGDKMPSVDLKPVEEAKALIEAPTLWTGRSLFVPDQYVINSTTNLPEKARVAAFYTDSLTKQPIPNQWFIDNRLSLLDPKVQYQDPDSDGFTNEDEWRGETTPPGSKSTDPNRKESHPPYYTKLFIQKFIRVPFRLKFQAYDGDPKKPDSLSFEINTLDLKQPTLFIPLGEIVPHTKFKVDSFNYKEVNDPSTGGTTDVSELTLVDTETQAKVTLIMNKITDSPDSFAQFQYEWALPGSQPPKPFRVKKLQEFALPPETAKRYKLLDIHEDEAVILTPDNRQVNVGRDTRQP